MPSSASRRYNACMANDGPKPIPLAYASPQPGAASRRAAIAWFLFSWWCTNLVVIFIDSYRDPTDDYSIRDCLLAVGMAAVCCCFGFIPVIWRSQAVARQFQQRLCGVAALCGVVSMLVSLGLGYLTPSSGSWVVFVLYVIAVVVVVPGITTFTFLRLAWRRQWFQLPGPTGLWDTCGYNLTGNVSGICPECGNPVPAKEPAA